MAVVKYAWFGIDRFFVSGVLRIVIWLELVSTIGGVAADLADAKDTGEFVGLKLASLRSPKRDTEFRITQIL